MRSGPEDDAVYLASLKDNEKRFTDKLANLKDSKDPWAEGARKAAETALQGIRNEISNLKPKKDAKESS